LIIAFGRTAYVALYEIEGNHHIDTSGAAPPAKRRLPLRAPMRNNVKFVRGRQQCREKRHSPQAAFWQSNLLQALLHWHWVQSFYERQTHFPFDSV
jgi:hypothetical protein